MSFPLGSALDALDKMGGHPQGRESGSRHVLMCLRSVGIGQWYMAQRESCFESASRSYGNADFGTEACQAVKRL